MTNQTRKGVILALIFAVGAMAYTLLSPGGEDATPTTTEAGSLGLNRGADAVAPVGGGRPSGINDRRDTGSVSTVGGGSPDGFKGTDEELQAVGE